VAARAQNLVVQHQDGPDRDLAAPAGIARLFERCPHESLISLDGHDPFDEQVEGNAEHSILACAESSTNLRQPLPLLAASVGRPRQASARESYPTVAHMTN